MHYAKQYGDGQANHIMITHIIQWVNSASKVTLTNMVTMDKAQKACTACT